MFPLVDSEGTDQTVNVQADQCFHCPHMPKDTFSNGTAHLKTKTEKNNETTYKT